MLINSNIFLDSLFLLLGDNSDRSKSIVKEFLSVYEKLVSKKEIVIGDEDLVDVYKSFIKTVISEDIKNTDKVALNILLLKVKTNDILKAYPANRDIIVDILTNTELISAKQLDEYLKRIRNVILQYEIDSTTRKIFAKSRNISDIVNTDDQEAELDDLKILLEKTLTSINDKQQYTDSKPSESYVNLSDPDSILKSLNKYVERSVRGVLRTGLQGLNRALGSRGGIGLGESVVFAASSHNYKSGMLISMMLWCAIYNTIEVTPGKTPLIYFVSLENEVHENLMDILKTLYARTEKKHVDVKNISSEEITAWLVNYFSKYNVKIIIDRYAPHEFSYKKFIQRCNHFDDLGYEMYAFILDYLSEARGVDANDNFSSQGQIQLIKENYLKFVNNAKQCGYMFATGHQLTKKAEEIARDTRYSVKRFNPSLMADSSDVHRIIDILFFLQLETNVEGRKFLTAINRKNRGNKDTKETDKFFAYPFTEFGIEDDLNDIPKFVTDIDSLFDEKAALDDSIVESAMF